MTIHPGSLAKEFVFFDDDRSAVGVDAGVKTMTTPMKEHQSDLALLRGLGLAPDELVAITQQGFVGREMRRQGPVFKLRFRLRKQQRIVFLGGDADRARQVRECLIASSNVGAPSGNWVGSPARRRLCSGHETTTSTLPRSAGVPFSWAGSPARQGGLTTTRELEGYDDETA